MKAAAQEDFHLYFPCNDDRHTPFKIDFTGVFFYFTVSYSTFMHSLIEHQS